MAPRQLHAVRFTFTLFPTMRVSLLLFAVLLLLSACHSKQRVDLILHHGKIYTVDSTFSIAEAIAVKDGKIVAIGSNDEVMKAYTSDSMMDAHGQSVYPGLIDAHAHFVGYGRSLFEVNLYGCKDWAEAVQRVQDFAKAHPD